MSDIYVYGPNDSENDYATMGLVGSLTPEDCTFKEVGCGDSIVTLKHPYDEFGRYTALEKGNIVSVPVPVRVSPEIYDGHFVTTVWTYKVKPLDQLTSKYQRTLYKKKTGSRRLQIMKPGDILTVVLKPQDEDGRWKARTEYGTGWIDPEGVELITEHIIPDNSEAIMEIQTPWVVVNQQFRIEETKKGISSLEITAKHISYDLLYNLTRFESEESIALIDAIQGVLKNCVAEHDFDGYTNVINEQAGLFYKNKNPIEAFLNPEEGICKKYNVGLIRDGHALIFIHDPGTNRGVKILYAKNMTGVNYRTSDDSVATRILPIGETKDGKELYLSDNPEEQYVDSPRINDYPVIHVYALKCENCKVGDKDENGGTITVDVARARMRAQAEKLIENKCDLPLVELDVQYENLGDTEEYAQFKDLESCFLYDYIIVQHPIAGIDVTAQINEIEWDCLKKRMKSVKIGTVGKTLANSGITTWQIPSGFSGSKLAMGTVGGGALQSDIISVRHMQAESINTEALQAESVTAEKIAAGSITADKIAAGSITADKIQAGSITADKIAAGSITADKIQAGSITADKIAAYAIEAKHIASKTITADQIAAGTITADSGIIGAGAIGTAQIADGSITDAKVVDLSANSITAGTLSVERLVITGSEKSIVYTINEANGTAQLSKTTIDGGALTQRTITADRIVAGAITAKEIASRTILANNIVAETITAAEIKAGSITASRLDVDDLFADDAFVNALTTSKIFANNGTLTIVATNAAKAITDAEEALADAESAGTAASDAQNMAEAAYNSYKDAVTRPEFERLIRVKTDGLHVGDNLTNSEMLIDSGSINAVVNGSSYSSFGAGYLQLGDEMRIRRPSGGGVAFTPIVR